MKITKIEQDALQILERALDEKISYDKRYIEITIYWSPQPIPDYESLGYFQYTYEQTNAMLSMEWYVFAAGSRQENGRLVMHEFPERIDLPLAQDAYTGFVEVSRAKLIISNLTGKLFISDHEATMRGKVIQFPKSDEQWRLFCKLVEYQGKLVDKELLFHFTFPDKVQEYKVDLSNNKKLAEHRERLEKRLQQIEKKIQDAHLEEYIVLHRRHDKYGLFLSEPVGVHG